MQKYFVNKIINNSISFNKDDEHHLIKVMRIKINDEIIAINQNKKYLAKISSLNPLRANVINEIKQDTTNNFNINIFLASIKPKYIELAITKATELNVNNFYIFYSNLSQHNIKHNFIRYTKIIKEASEQSNRNTLMNIKLINENEELLELLNKNDINLIADFNEASNNIDKEINNNKNIGIIIGPEGGFNQIDYSNIFNKIKYINIKLTKTILRAETALMYLVSVVSYILLKNEK